MSLLKLNYHDVEDDYFEGSTLWAIQSELPVFQICWTLNTHLGFDLQFDQELVLPFVSTPSTIQKKNSNKSIGLFQEDDDEQHKEQDAYFSVYRYTLPYSEGNLLLYKNGYLNQYLVKELRHVDYFLLLQNGFEVQNIPIHSVPQLNGIQLCTEIALSSLKHKDRLIL